MLIEKEPITLNDSQKKLLKSGWGEDCIESAITEKLTYDSDGLKVKGFFASPKRTGKFPCVIWCRGGYGNKGALDDFTAVGILGQLASWGYSVFASQYRGNAGGEGRDEFGGNDVNDVLNIINLADEFPEADTENWGIEGWSRGGMMTYLALTKTVIFKAATVVGGIANLKCNSEESPFMKHLYTEAISGELTNNDFCSSRSVVNFPEKLSRNTPILIIHGNSDNRVLPHDSLDLGYKLLELGHLHKLVMLENGDHFLRAHKKEVDELRKNWLNKFLKQTGDTNA